MNAVESVKCTLEYIKARVTESKALSSIKMMRDYIEVLQSQCDLEKS